MAVSRIVVGFYVLRQPVIMGLTYLLFFTWGWSLDGAFLTWVVVMTASLAVTLGMIELIIRPIPPLRFLLGVPRQRIPGLDPSAIGASERPAD